MIDLRNFTFTYHRAPAPTLRQVTLQVAEGECVVICGRSGCGKTTLVRLLNGLVPHYYQGEYSGSAYVGGMNVEDAGPGSLASVAGTVFQNPMSMFFTTAVDTELAFPLENRGINREVIRDRVCDIATEVGAVDLLGKSIFKVSGGQRQRVAFGAALASRPRVLILDEPTSNLDGPSIEVMTELIAGAKRAGVAVVVAEHRLSYLMGVADRFIHMDEGGFVGEYTPAELSAVPEAERRTWGLRSLEKVRVSELVEAKDLGSTHGVGQGLVLEDLVVGYRKGMPLRYLGEKLCFEPGVVTGVLGANGIGKTCLARTLIGLEKPLKGSIFLGGRRMTPRGLRKNSSLVMQDVNHQLVESSVRAELAFGASKEIANLDAHLEDIALQLGLYEFLDRHPQVLSGGQKQRLAVGVAALSGRRIVVLDEPSSGLDYAHMIGVGEVARWLAERGTIVVVVSHDAELLLRACGKIVNWG